MAIKTLTPIQAKYNEIKNIGALEIATVATDGFEFRKPNKTDEFIFVLVHNSDASTDYTITVKAPTTGSYAGTDKDLVVTLGEGEFAVIRLESAKWYNKNGTLKLIPENVAVHAKVVY